MIRLVTLLMTVLTFTAAYAADLGTPSLTDDISARKYFDPDRLLTTGGVQYKSGRDVTIEPQFGFGHAAWEREAKSGYDEVIHKVHAQAGGKIDLFQRFYLSAAAKVPVYTYEFASHRIAGTTLSQSGSSRHGYDFLHLPGGNLSWTGEMGVRLGKKVDLNLYYDQSILDVYQGGSGLSRPEDRFGTRIIFRFW
ncbi:MAG: hypothetical protein FD174_3484 [Geobacteraceae bacterium]|nr:MAG: hypothetical protein FD174_3484 [Geobacteraceae bacterium]